MNFRTFLEGIACGHCFQWACTQAMLDKSITVYHGMVHKPFSKDPPYPHAWIDKKGLYQDWQTMEAGFGGHRQGEGFPPHLFDELFDPQNVKKYTAQEIIDKRHETGHCGPW